MQPGNLREPQELGQKRNLFSKLTRYGWFILLAFLLLILWVLNVSIPGYRVEGCLTNCSSASHDDDGQVSILSLNMLHGFPSFEDIPTRLDLISTQIQQLDADIVLLQEVPWSLKTGSAARQLSARLAMNYAYFRANGNRAAILFEEGELILSKFPLKNPGSYELRPRAGFFENRVVLHADVVTPDGDLRMYVTHLTHGDPDINRGQAESLLTYVKSSGNQPKIVAGDFNATESSPQIITLSEEWSDSYRQLHPVEHGYTCCVEDLKSNPDEPYEKRIDYIFLAGEGSSDLSLLDAQRVFDHPEETGEGWQWASDHSGLMITILLDG